MVIVTVAEPVPPLLSVTVAEGEIATCHEAGAPTTDRVTGPAKLVDARYAVNMTAVPSVVTALGGATLME
jgi:hypothetical protein